MNIRKTISRPLIIALGLMSGSVFAAPNVITVGPFGSDFSDPVAAVNFILDASRTNPYVVSVSPGRFRLNTPLYLKPYVSLVGAGQQATFLVGRIDSAQLVPTGGPGLVNGADHTLIRDMTIINRFAGTAHAIHNVGASPIIRHVTAIATGGGGSGAFKAGLWDDDGSASRIEDSLLRGSGNGGASPLSICTLMEPPICGLMEPLFCADYQARTGVLFS